MLKSRILDRAGIHMCWLKRNHFAVFIHWKLHKEVKLFGLLRSGIVVNQRHNILFQFFLRSVQWEDWYHSVYEATTRNISTKTGSGGRGGNGSRAHSKSYKSCCKKRSSLLLANRSIICTVPCRTKAKTLIYSCVSNFFLNRAFLIVKVYLFFKILSLHNLTCVVPIMHFIFHNEYFLITDMPQCVLSQVRWMS